MGPSPVNSPYGSKYYIFFVDDHTKYTWFYLLKRKFDFFNTFSNFQRLVKNQFDRKIKIFQSDAGCVFSNHMFIDHLITCSIQ